MPFSLYGDLPEPSSDKSNNVKNTPTTTGSSLSGLYASLPAPGASSSATAATTTTTNTPPTTTTANTTPSPTISTTTTAASQTAAETNNNAPTSSPAPTTGVKPAGIQGDYHTKADICFSRKQMRYEIFHYEMDLMPTDILSMCAVRA